MRNTIIVAAIIGAALLTPSCSTPSNCSNVNWTELDGDGKPFIPVDVNNDGYIDCNSDFELGA